MTAAGHGRLEVLDVLLSHGADIRAKDKNNSTAGLWASREGYRDAVERLQQARTERPDPLNS
ncbi:ankyrin repeat domain-containing protein, partial [Baaleninema sp.]|uniref:ankyrin repeat domain-containing protein n=1 Tax=Baaleninema sp. TaxID=3101197 RepID=UPI003CFF918B